MTARGAVYAAHTAFDRTAPDAFHSPVAVNMLPGRSLETAVTVRGGTAVNAVLLIGIVHMEAICAFGAPGTIGG